MLLIRQSKISGAALVCIFFFLFSCSSLNTSNRRFSDSAIKEGKVVAAEHCQSCHVLPDPSLLDKKTWQNLVLPLMGPRLGIFEFDGQKYKSKKDDENLPTNFYPSQPLITTTQWQNIIDYYVTNSPDSLPPQKRNDSIQTGLSLFSVEIPSLKYNNPSTCLIKIDTSIIPHQLWTGDILKKSLYYFNDQLSFIDSVSTNGPIVDISFQRDKMVASNIGVFYPSTDKFGKAQSIIRNADKHFRLDTTLFDELSRPVQITPVDLNMDGKGGYLVCEFGFLTGALSWYQNLGSNKFERHTIREVPGSVKAYVTDYNYDGLPDIWALFAQGEEGIFLFTNKGNGQFDQEEVLRFPPSYGSSYFELADFNNDGFPDIIYTCGDNGDYKPVLKPYHGIYIFLNDKTNHFSKKYFFPINGCYKAVARDFDGDGDLDIATISFFADYMKQPEEGFVYLENKGDFKFMPFTLPETKLGRWLTMDVGDLNGDGRPDIVLGNCSFGPNIKGSVYEHWKKGPPFIVLKNVGIEGQDKKRQAKIQ